MGAKLIYILEKSSSGNAFSDRELACSLNGLIKYNLITISDLFSNWTDETEKCE